MESSRDRWRHVTLKVQVREPDMFGPNISKTAADKVLYLQPFSRYWALNILESRPWPFKVTWRHRSRDDSIPHTGFPIGAPLEPSPYLQAFSRYLTLKCACPIQIVIAHARYHVTCTPMQNFGTYLNFPPPHCLFTMTLLLGSDED